jgi:hypothetical protein
MKGMRWLIAGLLVVGVVGVLAAYAAEGTPAADVQGRYTVDVDPDEFVDVIDNPYMPLPAGARYVYEAQTADGLERVVVEVLPETRQVMGITATIVRDTVTLDGVLVEDTLDWFAQDEDGNVWYLGEAVGNYANGKFVDRAGSWEAGVDGALPGIVMYADPTALTAVPYRQEYYPGEAEDMAEVVDATETVTTPTGTYSQVLRTLETTPLEPDVREHKYYARGVGLVQAVDLASGEVLQLVEVEK